MRHLALPFFCAVAVGLLLALLARALCTGVDSVALACANSAVFFARRCWEELRTAWPAIKAELGHRSNARQRAHVDRRRAISRHPLGKSWSVPAGHIHVGYTLLGLVRAATRTSFAVNFTREPTRVQLSGVRIETAPEFSDGSSRRNLVVSGRCHACTSRNAVCLGLGITTQGQEQSCRCCSVICPLHAKPFPKLQTIPRRTGLSKSARLTCNIPSQCNCTGDALSELDVQGARRCPDPAQLILQSINHDSQFLCFSCCGNMLLTPQKATDAGHLSLSSMKARPKRNKRDPAGFYALSTLPPPRFACQPEGYYNSSNRCDGRSPASGLSRPKFRDTNKQSCRCGSSTKSNHQRSNNVPPSPFGNLHRFFSSPSKQFAHVLTSESIAERILP